MEALVFGQIGVVKEMVQRVSDEAFQGEQPCVIGTGGFSALFSSAKLFDDVVPDLQNGRRNRVF